MGWSAETLVSTDEAVSAYTPWILLGPGETINFFVERTDVAPADDWLINVHGTTNTGGGRNSDRTVATIYHGPTVTKKGPILFAGFYALRLQVANAVGGADVVKADVYYRKDGVAF